MTPRLFFRQLDNAVRAEADAESALNADHRLVGLGVPVDSAYHARLGAAAASDTLFLYQSDSSPFLRNERVCRTGAGARRVFAYPADDHDETALHPAVRSDTDAGLSQTRFVLPPRTGEHAALAADTSLPTATVPAKNKHRNRAAVIQIFADRICFSSIFMAYRFPLDKQNL
jgi:hypothetical protein